MFAKQVAGCPRLKGRNLGVGVLQRRRPAACRPMSPLRAQDHLGQRFIYFEIVLCLLTCTPGALVLCY